MVKHNSDEEKRNITITYMTYSKKNEEKSDNCHIHTKQKQNKHKQNHNQKNQKSKIKNQKKSNKMTNQNDKQQKLTIRHTPTIFTIKSIHAIDH